MKRAVLTGGTGFVGAGLARQLLADGHEVHLLVRQGYDPWRIENVQRDLWLHEVDLTDEEAVVVILNRIRPDWIFHLAAYGAYSWQTDTRTIFRTDVLGTTALVGACVRVGFETFVNSGSSSEYGFKDYAPSEHEWLDPNSNYAVAKSCGTAFCRFVARSRGVPIVTLRLYSVYGPFEDPARLMPTLIGYGLKGQLPPLVDPGVARDYVYLDDVVNAYLLAATRPSEALGAVYNVGTGVQTTMRDVVAAAQSVLGIAAQPHWGTMPRRVWDTTTWVADSSRIRRSLNWEPRFNLEAGLRAMVDRVLAEPRLLEKYCRRAGHAAGEKPSSSSVAKPRPEPL